MCVAYAVTLDPVVPVATLFGGCTALFNTWLSGRRLARAMEVARTEPGRETAILFVGAVHRFVSMAAAFAIGMGVLELPPMPLLMGFVVVYGGIIFVRPGQAATAPGVPKDK
jgi:hypothetical protein